VYVALRRCYEGLIGRAAYQTQGDFISGGGDFVGGAFDLRSADVEGGNFAGGNCVVFLPVLLFCVLCDREVSGSDVSVFGAVGLRQIFYGKKEFLTTDVHR
jgi:hypothetical protein